MTDEQDEIIVYRQFSDNIEASLAKSKLDAYGIPCFLSEENIAGLYPGQLAVPFHVRLHIFKRDIEEVSRIFMVTLPSAENGDPVCPRCHSSRIERDFPREFSARPWASLALLFFGIFIPDKKINHCLNCDHEF